MMRTIPSMMKYGLAAALAAAGMYWFDPVQGRRRRALVRDKLVSSFTQAQHATRTLARDAQHQLQGAAARALSAVRPERVSDDVVVARVRSALGRVTSHAQAIEVTCSQGAILLTGAVLKREHPRVLRTVRATPGVKEVRDELVAYERSDGISALQGGESPSQQTFSDLQQNWSPGARAVAWAAGTALSAWSLRQQRPAIAFFAAAAGGALIVRGATNRSLKRLAGGAEIEVRKTLQINAPVERVFATLARYENFPSFMRNVRQVTMQGDRRSHWVVAGPAGASVEWDAETTLYKPNEALAWRSVRNSTVDHAGLMRVRPEGGGTRLDVHLTYSPPAGALGHAVAKLFGADPKAELDEDLQRLKSFIESGAAPDAESQWQQPEVSPGTTTAPFEDNPRP